MNSFAPTDKTVDNRRNKEPVPEEIFAYGFVPPVQTPDGRWQAGDELPANWLNWLLNDMYKGVVTKNLTPSTPPANSSGYFAVQCGDLIFQGGTQNGLNTAGLNPLTFPVPFVAGSSPFIFVLPNKGAGSAAPITISIPPANNSHLSTNIVAQQAGAIVAPVSVTWLAVGHITANISGTPQGLRDLRTKNDFCVNAMVYPDGQDNLGAPGALTLSQGFTPPNVVNGVWVEGDGITAQVLNLLLKSVYAFPKYTGTPSDTFRNGAIEIGGVLLQWAQVNAGANSNRAEFTFPKAFADNSTEVFALSVQAFSSTPGPTLRFAEVAASLTTNTKGVAYLVDDAGKVAGAGSVLMLAIGKSGDFTPAPAINTFAAQDINYPDGQTNKVMPSSIVLSEGFAFETENTQGNYVTANNLNWLFNDLFKEMSFITSRQDISPPGYPTPATVLSLKIGRLLIQAGRVTAAQLSATGDRVLFEHEFAATPTVYAVHRSLAPVPAVGAAVTDPRYISVAARSTTDCTLLRRNAAGAVATDAAAMQYAWIAIGLAK